MHEQHAGRAADGASAMAAAADIVSEDHFPAAASVLRPVAGYNLQCTGKHNQQLAPGGRVPVLIQALRHLVTIVLYAGSTAERRAVWPQASVDALSTGKSISTNCEPPSGAAAKRTIFIKVLRMAPRSALV